MKVKGYSAQFESLVVVVFFLKFTQKCIKIIYFFIFKKLFFISANQNYLKTLKNINLKKIKFFKTLLKLKNIIICYGKVTLLG